MSQFSEEQLKRKMEDVKASFRVEGIEIQDDDDALVLARIRGEISQEEFLKRAKEAAKNV
ncbi:antitoxin VbhA family protein [Brevibacillus formosus]|uniref:antitoxin VbhA family protein n=1 Tax=Brevibacillus formosus TaxID=54913 RepID=UPI003F1C7F8D